MLNNVLYFFPEHLDESNYAVVFPDVPTRADARHSARPTLDFSGRYWF